MIELTHYIDAFSSLHTAKLKGHKAPHKAVLLLAIIDFIEEGVIRSQRIVLSDSLEKDFMKYGIIILVILQYSLLVMRY